MNLEKKMNDTDIQNYLPHRYPFLLIDKITDIVNFSDLKKN